MVNIYAEHLKKQMEISRIEIDGGTKITFSSKRGKTNIKNVKTHNYCCLFGIFFFTFFLFLVWMTIYLHFTNQCVV